jgi:hypothetical protein
MFRTIALKHPLDDTRLPHRQTPAEPTRTQSPTTSSGQAA